MQVQLNTDNHVEGHDALAAWVEGELKDKLSRFQDQITRIEVHLSDMNAARQGDNDKRCNLEARLTGRAPLGVSHDAGKVPEAFHGAVAKLVRALDTSLGRVKDVRGRESIRGQTEV